MAGPIVEEPFEEMDEAITRNWTKRRSKPVMLINFCYDERFGKQTVTVISNWIQNQLISDFVNSGHYSVVDNNDLERLRNEKKFQKAGYVDDEIMVDEGRELSGQYIVLSKISKFNTFDSKVVKIETTEIVYTSSKIIQEGGKIAK